MVNTPWVLLHRRKVASAARARCDHHAESVPSGAGWMNSESRRKHPFVRLDVQLTSAAPRASLKAKTVPANGPARSHNY